MSNNIKKPTKKDYNYWNHFKSWLRTIKIITVFDFTQYIEWLWRISENREYICLDNEMYFKRTEFEESYERISKDISNQCNYRFIRRMQKNNIFRISFVMEECDESNKDPDNYNNEDRLVQEIIQKNTLAVYDAIVDRRFMVGYWRFTNCFKDKISKGYICSDQWDLNTPGSAELITLMNVIQIIMKVVHSKEQGLIVVGNNNLKAIKSCNTLKAYYQ